MVCRYLISYPELVITYHSQHMPRILTGISDSDFAGCQASRKSTSAHCIMFGAHCVRTASNTQSTVSLSSPESEYYGVVKTASITIGIQSVLKDMGVQVGVEILSDASSGISLASRRGLGRTRHVATRFLWLQQHVRDRSVTIKKVKGSEKPSDIGTKVVGGKLIAEALARVGMRHTPLL